ncbi:signal transduction histidine kinase [Aurantimicrobium minutum]|uniref:hypothetical protein n=1 Tax=Aurantimicrobium minutum TaxID=708131 RepID=UPI002473FC80|nr:hypothetical protein [Aurantimicrobium minutum]MDH6277123.1 signal transduction histidine kinase [Aurantimicrobium minutum]
MMIISNFERFRKDAGGRWLGDLRAYFAFLPLWLSISVLVSPGFTNPQTLMLLLLANVVALAASTVLLLIFRATLFRRRNSRSIPLGVVMAAGAVLGGLKALLTTYLLWLFDPSFDLNAALVSRSIPTAFGGMWLLPIGAVLLAVRERYQIERDVLISETVQRATNREVNLLPEATSLQSLSEAEMEIHEFITQTRTRLQAEMKDGSQASVLLHDIIQTELRPLSHKIWKAEASKYTDFSVKDLARITIREHNFASIWILLVYSIACLPLEISAAGVQEGISRLAVQVSITAIFFEIARRVSTKSQVTSSLVFFGSIGLAVVATELVCTSLFGPLIQFNAVALNVVNALTLTTNALLIGIVRSAYESHESIRSKLVEQIGEEGLNNEYVLNRNRLHNRELAQFLHGNVQNQMLAAALRLELTPTSDVVKSVLSELENIESLLHVPEDAPRGVPQDISDLALELSTKWRGIIQLQLLCTPSRLLLSAEDCAAVNRVLNEGINNSVRHGLASDIEISIDIAPESIAVRLTDDGLGPRSGPQGLGTALYDSLAGANWKLEAGPESIGSVLTVKFFRRNLNRTESHTG